MKKFLIFSLLMPFFLKLQAQNTSLTLSTGLSDFYSFSFYEDRTFLFQPGFDVRLDFPFIRDWHIYSGAEIGLYNAGYKHMSDNVDYRLNIQLWHFSAPLYYRFENEHKKWHPRFGLNLNIPLKYTYTYDIYDNGEPVYHNSDKPYKNKYYDYIQLLFGFDVDIAKHWQFDFQTRFFLSGNVSIGIKYLFPLQTEK